MRFQPTVIAVALLAAATTCPVFARPLAPAALRGSLVGPIAPNAQLSLYISLQGQHANEIDRLIDAQNTPGSPLYRHYLTPSEYGRYFGAPDREYAAAIALLRARGFVIDDLPANHADIEAHAPARAVEELFGTPIDLRAERGRIFYTNRYQPVFPASLHILAVGGLENYVRWRPHSRTRPASPNSTVGSLTGWGPPDIQSAYDLGPVYAQYTGQGETVVDATYGTVRTSDFKAFKQQFGLNAKLSQIGLDGAPVDNQGESTLDVEWMAAIAPSAKILLVSAGNDTIGFLRMHRYIVNNLSQDHIVSTSWGWCEQYFYNAFGFYVGGDQRLFAQAQTEGQWWLAAAGDQGADDCEMPRGTGPVSVDYPGSSRYVMDVGGTALTPATISGGNYAGWANEVVWNDSCGASAGGKSVLFPKPSYQMTVAPKGYMREVPDVTLMADGCDIGGYIIYLKGGFQNFWYGTSFAAPEWAAFLALVQQRYGSTPIASPLYRLYALAATPAYTSLFHDIVSGCNHFKGVPGFCAAPGYDDASGLGSFVGAALQAAY
jgi:subtilase family serine protease